MERIVYRILADEDHVLTRQRRHQAVQGKSTGAAIRPWIACVLLALLFSIQVAARSWGLAAFSGSMLLIALSLPFLGRMLERKQARRAVLGKSEADLTATIELDQAGLRGRDAQAEVSFGWPYFTKARSFEDGVLLYDADQHMRWLPHAALEAGTSEQIESLMREKVADFVLMHRPKR